MPLATIKVHAYTLQECLLLTDRNIELWASKARLAAVHGQLDEARWTPFSYWSASTQFGFLPPIGGRRTTTRRVHRALQRIRRRLAACVVDWRSRPIPLWTFGKIDAIKRAAEANVRYTEWDLEKTRQQTRMDVRRAYFGLMLARDMQYIATDVLQRLDRAIEASRRSSKRGTRRSKRWIV